MKRTHIRITTLAYFFIDTLNWQVFWGKEKYLLNSLYEKLFHKKTFFKTNVSSKESVFSKDKQIN